MKRVRIHSTAECHSNTQMLKLICCILSDKYLQSGKSPRSAPPHPIPDVAPFCAYLQRLPRTTTKRDLISWFHLPVDESHIYAPKPFPNQLAIAYVTFESRAELEDFILRDGEQFYEEGWHLDVMVADNKEQMAARKKKKGTYNPHVDNPAKLHQAQPEAKKMKGQLAEAEEERKMKEEAEFH